MRLRTTRDTSGVLRSPYWADLVALLDAVCVQQGFLKKDRRPNDDQLARACGVSPSTVQGRRHYGQRPSRALLETVAGYAGQPLEPWLAAAGLATGEEHSP